MFDWESMKGAPLALLGIAILALLGLIGLNFAFQGAVHFA